MEEAYQDEEFGVVLVGEGREGDGAELPAFQPVNSSSVDSHSFLRRDIRPILEVVVLPLLLCLQIQPGQPATATSLSKSKYENLQKITLFFCGLPSRPDHVHCPRV